MLINAQGSIAIPARKSVDKARMPRDVRDQTGAILPLVAPKRCAPRDVVPVQGGSWRGNRCGNADAAIRTARRAGPAGYVPRAMEPQPPQVQRMRWQMRCVPSTTQRAGTKRHTRQVKADRQPRYEPDRPKLQVRTTWQSRPTLKPAGCAMRGGAANPTAPQAISASSQLRSLAITMRPENTVAEA